MKCCMTWTLAVCLGMTISYPTLGQDIVGGAAAAASGATRATSRATVRVPTRTGADAATRAATQAGANFNAANLRIDASADANVKQRTSVGTDGLRAGVSARAASNANIRMRQAQAQRGEQNQSTEENRGATQTHQGTNATLRSGINVTGLSRGGVDVRFSQRMAQVDRMRDAALARGDFALLEQADLMEQQLRIEHAQQAAADARLGSNANPLFYSVQPPVQSAGQFAVQTQQNIATQADARARTAAQAGTRYAQQGQNLGQAAATDGSSRGNGLVTRVQAGTAIPPVNISADQRVQGQSALRAGVPTFNGYLNQSADLENRVRLNTTRPVQQTEESEQVPGSED